MKETKMKKEVKESYSYRTYPDVYEKAKSKVHKESKGRKSLSAKIEELLYDFISR